MLVWPRELPIEGSPPDVVEAVEKYGDWLASSDDVPKLLLTFDPGAIMNPAYRHRLLDLLLARGAFSLGRFVLKSG